MLRLAGFHPLRWKRGRLRIGVIPKVRNRVSTFDNASIWRKLEMESEGTSASARDHALDTLNRHASGRIALGPLAPPNFR
jgi:hypothetical protein